MGDAAIALAAGTMRRFAERTGLSSPATPRRYLWTDAFAVCTFFALSRATGEASFERLALDLVHRVHDELGRLHGRWISGLAGDEARAHPTAGGLRIGKPLPERGLDEPFDADLEWERDGQYFHYLTKWMHALDQTARITGDATYHRWARELADVAHRAFTRGERGRRRMVWKASVDLSRALVPSMGQHDPLEGLVTCRQLEATAHALSFEPARPSLDAAVGDFVEMIDVRSLETDDPLGVGGLLTDASRLAQLGDDDGLLGPVVDAAEEGLRSIVVRRDLHGPVQRRLAFRELGLAIGLAAVAPFEKDPRFAKIARFQPLRREIEHVWCAEDSRRSATWLEHEDIDDVMLATALVPDGFVRLASPPLTSGADCPPMASPA